VRSIAEEESMLAGNLLYYALVALVIAIVAGVLGFGGIAGTAAGIAQTLFYAELLGPDRDKQWLA
jgi:uncharacterized membrane protein YtjA (UPF0391 family)